MSRSRGRAWRAPGPAPAARSRTAILSRADILSPVWAGRTSAASPSEINRHCWTETGSTDSALPWMDTIRRRRPCTRLERPDRRPLSAGAQPAAGALPQSGRPRYHAAARQRGHSPGIGSRLGNARTPPWPAPCRAVTGLSQKSERTDQPQLTGRRHAATRFRTPRILTSCSCNWPAGPGSRKADGCLGQAVTASMRAHYPALNHLCRKATKKSAAGALHRLVSPPGSAP